MTLDPTVYDPSRFDELSRSPHFDQVVAANRLYLATAVAFPLETEQSHWSLSCLPTTGGTSKFCTLSMGGQETFAVYRPGEDGILYVHVFVTESTLRSFGADLAGDGIQLLPSPYRAAGGEDQVRVLGSWEALAPVLADRPLRNAARDFAERQMTTRTSFAHQHDPWLAGRVLGRS